MTLRLILALLLTACLAGAQETGDEKTDEPATGTSSTPEASTNPDMAEHMPRPGDMTANLADGETGDGDPPADQRSWDIDG